MWKRDGGCYGNTKLTILVLVMDDMVWILDALLHLAYLYLSPIIWIQYQLCMLYLAGASMWYLGKGFVDYVISVDIPFNEVQLEIPYRRVWRYPKTYLDLNKYTHTIQQVPATMGDTGVSMTAENNYEITRDLLWTMKWYMRILCCLAISECNVLILLTYKLKCFQHEITRVRPWTMKWYILCFMSTSWYVA